MNSVERIVSYTAIALLIILLLQQCNKTHQIIQEDKLVTEQMDARLNIYRDKYNQSVAEVLTVNSNLKLFKERIHENDSTMVELEKMLSSRTQSAAVIKEKGTIHVNLVPDIVFVNGDTSKPIFSSRDSSKFHDIAILASKDSIAATIKLFSDLHLETKIKKDRFWRRSYLTTVATELNPDIEIVDIRTYQQPLPRTYTGLKIGAGIAIGFGFFLLLNAAYR